MVDSTQTTKQDSSTSLTGAVAPLPPKEFTEGEICIQPSDSGKSKKTQKTTTMTTPSTVVGIIEEPDDKLILPPPPPHTKPKITYVEPNTLRGDTIIINKEDITKHKTMGKPILPSKQK